MNKSQDNTPKNESDWPMSVQKENKPETYDEASDVWHNLMFGRKFESVKLKAVVPQRLEW